MKFTDFLGAFTRRTKSWISRQPKITFPTEIRIIEKSRSGDLTEAECDLIYIHTACPDCYSLGGLIQGPSGGWSQNCRCANCGMGFNLAGGMGDHRIGLPYHLWDKKLQNHRDLISSLLNSHGINTSEDNWGIEFNGKHGIWIWPTRNFATVPDDAVTIIKILTWDLARDNIFKFWESHPFQLQDPEFIAKIKKTLANETN